MQEKTIIYLFGGTKLGFQSDEQTPVDQKIDLLKQLLDDCQVWDYHRKKWHDGDPIIAIDKIKEQNEDTTI